MKLEDLLPRDPVPIDLDPVLDYVIGKTALVTGGGGSIGSEICRQLAEHHIGKLVIFDIYENLAYELLQELKWKYPEIRAVVLIGSVRDEARLEQIFREYRPELVFHAAAHKHVPLMEDSPNEAIKNNVIGTYQTSKMADRFHAEKFILQTRLSIRQTSWVRASVSARWSFSWWGKRAVPCFRRFGSAMFWEAVGV